MNKEINSLQNPLVKQIVLLKDKSRARRKTGLFIAEGEREIQLAIRANYSIKTLLYFPEIISKEKLVEISASISSQIELIAISKIVYQKIAYRETTEGIVAIIHSKSHHLKSLNFASKAPLILVAEAPEKPGNIGAILRTTDAANVDAVIIANPKTDLYNPNIIRSSVGCVFTNTIVTASTENIISFLKAHHINSYAATLQASKHYHTQDFTKPTAIIVGTEATGLSEKWRKASTQNIIIPMQGQIDSMNVSVAAGILIFEAKRQRNFF